MTPFQKRVKTALMRYSDIDADAIVCKRSGVVEVQRYYFYRPSGGAVLWSEDVKMQLASAGIDVSVSSRDDWRAWPAPSYLVAIVKPV